MTWLVHQVLHQLVPQLLSEREAVRWQVQCGDVQVVQLLIFSWFWVPQPAKNCPTNQPTKLSGNNCSLAAAVSSSIAGTETPKWTSSRLSLMVRQNPPHRICIMQFIIIINHSSLMVGQPSTLGTPNSSSYSCTLLMVWYPPPLGQDLYKKCIFQHPHPASWKKNFSPINFLKQIFCSHVTHFCQSQINT